MSESILPMKRQDLIGIPEYPYPSKTLNGVGKITGEAGARRIQPDRFLMINGCGKHVCLVLKSYVLTELDKKQPTPVDIENIQSVLTDEIAKHKIAPLSGLGFLVASSGIMNVCRWDNKYSDVIVPRIYTPKRKLWTPQEVEKVGAFCSGEKRVYDHENNAWLKYLNSARGLDDKVEYLNDFLVEK